MKKTGFIAAIVFCIAGFAACNNAPKEKAAANKDSEKFFPDYDFDAATFQKAPRGFGPFTRWWWPGNDVTSEELQREIKMLADNGFAGVEIQPFTVGLTPVMSPQDSDKVYSWDSPSFYEHVKAVMEQARISGITVDMNGGSGWPIGGPQVKQAESMLTLVSADTTIAGGTELNIPVPVNIPDNTGILFFGGMPLFNKVDFSLAKLQAVVASRIVKEENGQVYLDERSNADITANVANGKLNFKVPDGGNWKIIAFWSLPDGEKPALVAAKGISFVPDHLNEEVLRKTYDHLFGSRTGLPAFAGAPFRAVFNDSYEFKPDRHFSEDFLAYFKAHRGYDIRPWLASNIQRGYNNAYAAFIMPGAKTKYIYSGEDWRLRYDYDLTVGELFRSRFIATSNKWMGEHSLLHRTQAYGVKMDIIGGSGAADIPEAEQLFADGDEGFIKLVTSGAHLYNRPVISEESFVFMGRAEMTTPQKIRVLTDKALTAGINQVFYHGTPYKYQTGAYGKEGWTAFSTPFLPVNFSSDINESYPYWKNIKEVNQYIARAQYAMRSGKPHTDVLIYFPYNDFTDIDITPNPAEILTTGYFKGVEPALPASPTHPAAPSLNDRQQWFMETYKTINALNEAGITWEWVNDASLQEAGTSSGNITIRGNTYQALVIAHAPYMQLQTARHLLDLSGKGMNLFAIGDLPSKQPSFSDYTVNDAKTKQWLEEAFARSSDMKINKPEELVTRISAYPHAVHFDEHYNFTRTIQRQMKDGSIIDMIWNQSDKWQTISLTTDAAFTHNYWLDAAAGTILAATGNHISYRLPPYSSVILYAGKTAATGILLAHPPADAGQAAVVTQLDKWDINAGDAAVKNSSLFDWQTNPAFKFQSADGIYTSSFQLNKENGATYFIDLGTVYFTADIYVNNKPAGVKIWSPYIADISSLLQQGNNTIEVRVRPTQRNEFLSEAQKGNTKYAHYKAAGNTFMPAGLVGPVVIRKQ